MVKQFSFSFYVHVKNFVWNERLNWIHFLFIVFESYFFLWKLSNYYLKFLNLNQIICKISLILNFIHYTVFQLIKYFVKTKIILLEIIEIFRKILLILDIYFEYIPLLILLSTLFLIFELVLMMHLCLS